MTLDTKSGGAQWRDLCVDALSFSTKQSAVEDLRLLSRTPSAPKGTGVIFPRKQKQEDTWNPSLI
jgi:hypothetical protein